MRTIITTTGTSIAQGIPPLKPDPTDNEQGRYREAIADRLRSMRERHGDDKGGFLREACAESNSLHAFGTTESDEVVLLHSETPDGKICAAAVKKLLEGEIQCDTSTRAIDGLQVSDAEKFRRVAIQNLFQTLAQVHRQHSDHVVLNATGGFKSVVPYLTLYGVLQRLPVIYIFERSDTLITLPPAPLSFDYERISRARDALLRIERDSAIPREDFFKSIPGLEFHERDWYEALLEDEGGGQVTLSAFGFLLRETIQTETAQVLLSPHARRQYDQAEGDVRQQFTFMLERVGDPVWRHGKRHHFNGTELTVFKPGNTAERMACILRGSRIYVCELLREETGQYPERLQGTRESDYDLGEFTPWSRPPDEPPPPTSEEEAYRKACDRADQADQQAAIAEGLLNMAALLSFRMSSSFSSAPVRRFIAILVVRAASGDVGRRVAGLLPERGGEGVGRVGDLLKRDLRIFPPETVVSRRLGSTSRGARITNGELG